MGDLTKCAHVWEDSGGYSPPNFRMNRQMALVPIAHVICRKCNTRTWLSEEQWSALPVAAGTGEER